MCYVKFARNRKAVVHEPTIHGIPTMKTGVHSRRETEWGQEWDDAGKGPNWQTCRMAV